MSLNNIILYDIPFIETNRPWSPNTWRTRYCLNYKRLPYKTEWIEYPDIESLCVKLGAKSTGFKDDGVTPTYTLPVIFDPSTGLVISDSFDIAEYLDNTYPDTPRILPFGTRALQLAFAQHAMTRILALGPFVRPAVCKRLPERSEEYFRRTREAMYKVKMDEWTPKGEERVVEWGKVKVAFGKLASLLKEEDEFVLGDTISFADFVLGAILQWCMNGFGGDSEEWRDIQTWNAGRWTRLLRSLEPFAAVV